MGKEKGLALSSIAARDMHRFLERCGYTVEPGQHTPLRFRHQQLADVGLSLRPSDNLSYVAVKQISAVMGLMPEQPTAAIRERPGRSAR